MTSPLFSISLRMSQRDSGREVHLSRADKAIAAMAGATTTSLFSAYILTQ